MVNSERRDLLPYMVGGLLYTPALNSGIVEKIEEGRYPCLTSAALCLEDSVQDGALERAERTLRETLLSLKEVWKRGGKLPLLFVRIRTPQHLERVHKLLGEAEEILTGYILPKFDMSNAEAYAALIRRLDRPGGQALYYMPILESGMVAEAGTRISCLTRLKEICDGVRERILNIRVGASDLCNLYGLRRSVTQTIYEIGVVRDTLVDIINVFGGGYVVSGPVWEYFGADQREPWAAGLRRELALDRLNGFIGKTAVHPTQLPLIYQGMKVSRRDYEDALSILKWSETELGVARGGGGRMNEVKCHTKWARRTAALAQVYGLQEEREPDENV